jgi:multidrug efflux system membrane fusion protein
MYSGLFRWKSAKFLLLGALPALLLVTSCSSGGAEGTQQQAGSKQEGDRGRGGDPASSDAGRSGGGKSGRAGRGGGRGEGGGAVPVTTTKVAEMPLPVFLQGVGNVEAYSTVEIRPQVTGPLLTVNFNEGQDVEKDQLLFTIDPRPFEIALKQAETQLLKDQGQSKTLETQRARNANLFKQGLIAQSDVDTQAAQANSLLSTIALDQVAIDNAKLQLQYTKILAPVTGRTGALNVHVGSLVRTTDATPMVVVNQITPVRVTFSLPAVNLPAIRAGQTRSALQTEALTSDDTKAGTATGTLSFIDNVVDQTTSTIRLKATFPNSDRKLWPGEFVQVRLRVAYDPRALVVPPSAVQNGPQGQYVYIVDQNHQAALRPIKVARTEANRVVIAEGLRAGEEVVTDGQLRLTPGARVSIKSETGAQAQ